MKVMAPHNNRGLTGIHQSPIIMRFSKKSIELYIWLRRYKSKRGCSSCPESDYRCLEFHHIRFPKSFNIGDGAKRGYTKKKMLTEMKKCVILCKNCHAKVTQKVYTD